MILGWHTMFVKLIELVETVFFVLRKKQNQISFLHVYHHVTTFVMLWLFVKYSLGKNENPCIKMKCLKALQAIFLSFSYWFDLYIHKLVCPWYLISKLMNILHHKAVEGSFIKLEKYMYFYRAFLITTCNL